MGDGGKAKCRGQSSVRGRSEKSPEATAGAPLVWVCIARDPRQPYELIER